MSDAFERLALRSGDQWRARAEAAEAEVLRIHHEKVDHFEARIAAEARCKRLEGALEFYADPETYLAIGFFPDPPCGDFMEDWSDTGEEYGFRPGKLARTALSDTAQQETGETRSCPNCGGGGQLQFNTPALHKCGRCKGTGRLPIDPETGGADA